MHSLLKQLTSRKSWINGDVEEKHIFQLFDLLDTFEIDPISENEFSLTLGEIESFKQSISLPPESFLSPKLRILITEHTEDSTDYVFSAKVTMQLSTENKLIIYSLHPNVLYGQILDSKYLAYFTKDKNAFVSSSNPEKLLKCVKPNVCEINLSSQKTLQADYLCATSILQHKPSVQKFCEFRNYPASVIGYKASCTNTTGSIISTSNQISVDCFCSKTHAVVDIPKGTHFINSSCLIKYNDMILLQKQTDSSSEVDLPPKIESPPSSKYTVVYYTLIGSFSGSILLSALMIVYVMIKYDKKTICCKKKQSKKKSDSQCECTTDLCKCKSLSFPESLPFLKHDVSHSSLTLNKLENASQKSEHSKT